MSDGNVTDELSGRVMGVARTVHSTLASGFTEAVHQNALAIEMAREVTPCEREVPLEVRCRGEMVGHPRGSTGEWHTDRGAEGGPNHLPEHEVQIVNHLAATDLETALPLNSGARSLQIKKKFRTPAISNPVHPAFESC